MKVIILFTIMIPLIMAFAKKSRSWAIAMAVCVLMICIAGLRHGYIDTRAYRHGFEDLDPSVIFSEEFFRDEEYDDYKDKGFAVLSALIKLITTDSQVFLFIMSAITVGFLFWGIVNNVSNIEMGIFLFVATGLYIDTMNGIRQCLVAAILFFFLPRFIKEKAFIKYAALVLLLSTIHMSAILFIPLYFLVSKPAWSNYTWLVIIVTLLCYVFFNSGVGQALVDILEGTVYGEDYSEMLLSGNTSVNVIRVGVAAAPILLSLYTRGGKYRGTPMYNIVFHMALINLLVWIFATKVLYFYRLSTYFTPYMILLLCYELNAIANPQERRFVTAASYILYFGFHIYSCYIMGDQLFVGYLKY